MHINHTKCHQNMYGFSEFHCLIVKMNFGLNCIASKITNILVDKYVPQNYSSKVKCIPGLYTTHWGESHSRHQFTFSANNYKTAKNYLRLFSIVILGVESDSEVKLIL